MSATEICNVALAMIGEKAITSLTEDSKTGRVCNLLYLNKLDYILRMYSWKFATTRVTLAPDAAAPDFEFTYQFTLPSDYIKLIELYPNSITYKFEGNKILCDETELCIRYTARIEDTSMMDGGFKEAFSALLARELAIPISDSMSKQRTMDELYEAKIAEARFAGSIEDDLQQIEANDWINSRY